VGGHSFSPTSFMPDPFIRTFARSSLGFGASPELKIPPVEIGGVQYELKTGQLVYALLEVEFQSALRPWLALDIQVNVNGRLANETISLLSQGVVLVSGSKLGFLFQAARTKDLTLAVSAGAYVGSLTDVNIGRFTSALMDSGVITPENAVSTTTPAVLAFTGIRGAWAINELVGILFDGELGYGEDPSDRRSDRWFYTLAAVADLNMTHQWKTPIGFSLGAKTETNPAGSNDAGENIISFFAGINYLGAQDFDLGVDLSYSLTPVPTLPGEKTQFLAAIIDMRLIF